jgi:hypothetical protein
MSVCKYLLYQNLEQNIGWDEAELPLLSLDFFILGKLM